MNPAVSAPPLLLLLVLGAQAYLPLPDYVRPCSIKLSDRKMSECAKKSAIEVLPKVMKGDPKYNVPVLNPLYIDRMVVIDGRGPLGMQLVATDLYLHGIADTIIDNITHQSNPQTDTYAATIPDVRIDGKYNVSGRILLLPIVGQGNVVMHLKSVRIIYQFDWELKKLEDGETYYLPLPGARFDIDVDGMTVKLDNLFNGDKALVETTNKFLNDEWREVYESLKPAFAKEISKLITDILNGIYTQVRYKDAFMDVEV